MADQRPGVDIGQHRNPELLHEFVGDLLRAPVGTDFRELAHNQSLDVRTHGFVIFWICAVVSNFGIGQDDDLPGIRWIGENFLVSGNGSIKNDFARALAFSAVAFASEDSAVFECKDRLHCDSWEWISRILAEGSCGLPGKSCQSSAVGINSLLLPALNSNSVLPRIQDALHSLWLTCNDLQIRLRWLIR